MAALLEDMTQSFKEARFEFISIKLDLFDVVQQACTMYNAEWIHFDLC